MGKIIEFVGANGVGKSATYNTLVTLWSTNMCWIPCEKVKFVEKGNSKIEDLVVKFKSFTGKKGIELITFSQKNKAIQNFEYDNKEYVDFVWHCLSNFKLKEGTPDIRYKLMNFMYFHFALNDIIKKMDINKFVVNHEGLYHNINYAIPFTSKFSTIKTMVSRIVKIANFADVVVYFNTDEELIFERLKNRKNVIPIHEGLEDKDLKELIKRDLLIKELMIQELLKSGKEIIEVDSRNTQSENANYIISKINVLGFN